MIDSSGTGKRFSKWLRGAAHQPGLHELGRAGGVAARGRGPAVHVPPTPGRRAPERVIRQEIIMVNGRKKAQGNGGLGQLRGPPPGRGAHDDGRFS